MPIGGSLLSLQFTEPVSRRKCEIITSNECEWAFSYQFFATGSLWIWSTFLLKPLKPVFCNLRFPLNLKTKYQQLNTKGRSSTTIPLAPVNFRSIIPLKWDIEKTY
jgi:hypothetical protein